MCFLVPSVLLMIASVAFGGVTEVEIMYESNCPYSKAYLSKQFCPNYEEFKDSIDVTFRCFGKSESNLNETGKFEFSCQHGQPECENNMRQTCAISMLKGDQESQVKFVCCVMTQEPSIYENCYNEVELDAEKVEACSKGDKGIKLQLVAERSSGLIEETKNVPSMLINGTADPMQTGFALTDFKGFMLNETRTDQ